jgi:TetR/AcrR family transcriptional repressor of nem operon
MDGVHETLDLCLRDESLVPLRRARRFIEMVQQSHQNEGYLGCLLGGLGQELSGISEVFRLRIEGCLPSWPASR